MISCRDSALKLLSFKDRTENEMKKRLLEKGFEESEVEETMDFLKEYSYIDDADYALRFARDCVNMKKWGKFRIMQELIKKGIDRETAEISIEKTEIPEREIIENELKTRFSDSDFSNPRERNRIFSYFARRGFQMNEIKGAINEACSFDDIQCDDFIE